MVWWEVVRREANEVSGEAVGSDVMEHGVWRGCYGPCWPIEAWRGRKRRHGCAQGYGEVGWPRDVLLRGCKVPDEMCRRAHLLWRVRHHGTRSIIHNLLTSTLDALTGMGNAQIRHLQC